MAGRILKYKFVPPQAIEGAIPRSHLLERTLVSPAVRAVFVQAPAGHGKTTLLQQIMATVQARGVATGWFTLDEGDDDPTRFLSHLHAVIDSAQPPGGTGLPAARAQSPGGFGPIDEILGHISAVPAPLAVFIDEFHVIKSAVIVSIMARLLERLPPHATFHIGSRNLPDLGLARLQLRNAAVVLKTEDLRFTRSETASFLAGDAGAALNPHLVEDLFQRTEGWPAALQLARLALQGGADMPSGEVLGFSHEPEFEEYLADNVLALQTPATRDFLLATSILERVTPALCDVLTGGKDAERALRHLETSGLFIRPLGAERRWFKFHSLFSSYLRRQLRLRRPADVPRLHRLAMEWFLRHDYPEDAIYHAVEARDFAAAAATLESWSAQLVREARLATVERWLDVLPIEDVLARPQLQMRALWALLFLRRFHRARPLFNTLLAEIESGRVAYADLRTMPLLTAVRHLMEDDIVAAGRTLLEVDLRGAGSEPFEWFECGAIANIQSLYLRTLGRFAEARKKAQLGIDYSAQGSAVFSGAYAMAFSGITSFAQGRLREALVQYRRGFEEARRLPGSYASAVVAACYAEALYYDDALDEARSLLQDALPLISQACMVDALAVAHVTLAKILVLQGAEVDADYVLREAENIGRASGLPRIVRVVQWERVRQLLQRDEVDEARALADRLLGDGLARGHAPHVFHAEELDGDDLGHVRLLVHEQRAHEALRRLPHLLRDARRCGRVLRWLKLKILEAMALAAGDQAHAAKRAVVEVLRRAAPEGFARFLVEEPRFVGLIDATRNAETGSAQILAGIPAGQLDRILGGRPGAGGPPQTAGNPCASLTDRELEILVMLARGVSNRDIGASLYVSENTVKYHLRNIYSKLSVRNRTEASHVALRHGIV